MRKWIPAFLIVGGFALGGLAYGSLPAVVQLDLNGAPAFLARSAEPMPRALVAFVFPVVGLVVWLLLAGLASPKGERVMGRVFASRQKAVPVGAVDRFRPTYDVIIATVLGFVLLLQAGFLGLALSWPVWTARTLVVSLGVVMMVAGNVLPRTRPNLVAGLRTSATLADPDLWRRTHRWFGGLLMVTGVAVIATAFVSIPVALLVAVLGALASAIVATTVGRRGAGSSSVMAAALLVAIGVPAPRAVASVSATVGWLARP